ncbi:MAG TPA: hypothetical protein VI032_00800 [Burkholderiaceae bacterium]
MTLLRTLACAALIAAVGTTAIAQTKPSPTGPDGAPLVTPSGMTAPRPTPANTPASAAGLVMTPQEREQQRRDLERAKTGDECRAVVEKQRQQLAQRARERGEPAPSKPATDPCVGR